MNAPPRIAIQKAIVNPKKLETGLRTIRAGILYTLLLRIEAIGFPTFGLLLHEGRGTLHIRTSCDRAEVSCMIL